MKNKKILSCALSMFCLCIAFTIGPGYAQEVSVSTGPVVNEALKEKIPTYTYKSAQARDPFIPLISRSETTGKTTVAGSANGIATREVNVELLVLKGYVFSQQRKYALFKSADGAAFVLDKGSLLDERGKKVPGIAGIVKQDKVVLITKKNKIKEFKLREESE